MPQSKNVGENDRPPVPSQGRPASRAALHPDPPAAVTAPERSPAGDGAGQAP